jgi:predicted GNAT superfamily acetyltransferase
MTDATTSPAKQDIRIRSLHSAEEMKVCVDLQQRVWGYVPIDVVPDQIFIVAAKTGGHVLVAYDQDDPIGFALAFAAVRNGHTYLHSHMVAVIEEFQNRGVGRMLKLAQREDALERGFDLIEWTFDPLQLKNARFNIDRLGAIIRHYIPNVYGLTSSRLHAGLPTDRLLAEWWVRSPRVESIVKDQAQRTAPNSRRASISIPASIRDICRDDPSAAQKIQSQIRDQFNTHFANGLAVLGFDLNREHGTYLLEPYED